LAVLRLDRRALRLRVLAAVRRALPPPRRVSGPPRRVLVVRPDHIGDVLLCGPALRRLRAALPEAHVSLLAGPWSAEAAAGLEDVDSVLVYPMPGFEWGLAPWEPYRRALALARRLARERFDLALVLRDDYWWGALVCALAGIPIRAGFDLPETRLFLTRTAAHRTDLHEVEKDWRVVTAGLGTDPTPLDRLVDRLAFRTRPEDEVFAARFLGTVAGNGAHGEVPFLVLHPPARSLVKRWTPEAFAAVARRFRRRGWRVVVTGAAGERALVEEVTGRAGDAIPLVGAPLGALAAVLRRASLVVGVDSGPLHLAVAMGTPSVALFGPIDPVRFGPWGDPERHRFVATRMACAPCDRLDYTEAELPDHLCTPLIPAAAVIAAAEGALGGQGDKATRRQGAGAESGRRVVV
jgi:heptosyltransferase-2/heptosyltransferase-3